MATVTSVETGHDLESLRVKMLEAASLYGINHPLVLHYSRLIDAYHNRLLADELSRQPVECQNEMQMG
ncbi:hypothetical protein [Salsuginibacillus kocurii]|uniref:hypothetical protein n=1 Tax=Salsuginibacillus kocurii TaxID=427078 RepID=UPI00035F1184|nr:hypothetical protein [Salsuginibacillus kocurii]